MLRLPLIRKSTARSNLDGGRRNEAIRVAHYRRILRKVSFGHIRSIFVIILKCLNITDCIESILFSLHAFIVKREALDSWTAFTQVPANYFYSLG